MVIVLCNVRFQTELCTSEIKHESLAYIISAFLDASTLDTSIGVGYENVRPKRA